MLVLLISAAGALAIFLLLYFLIKTQIVPDTQMHQRLRKLKYGSQVQAERETAKTLSDIPFVERTIAPFFHSMAESLTQFAPKGIHDQLERRIMLAGKQGVWSVTAFVCGWVLSVAACLLIAFFLLSDADLPFIQRAALLVLGWIRKKADTWTAPVVLGFLGTLLYHFYSNWSGHLRTGYLGGLQARYYLFLIVPFALIACRDLPPLLKTQRAKTAGAVLAVLLILCWLAGDAPRLLIAAGLNPLEAL